MLELPFKCIKNPKEILCDYTQPLSPLLVSLVNVHKRSLHHFVLIRVVELCKNTSLWLHMTNQWFFQGKLLQKNLFIFGGEKAWKEICFFNVKCVFSTKICLVLNQKIQQKPQVVITWWLPKIKVGWPDENNRLPRMQGRSKIHWVFLENFGISHHFFKKLICFFTIEHYHQGAVHTWSIA